jgi:2'-5' RNA ligase
MKSLGGALKKSWPGLPAAAMQNPTSYVVEGDLRDLPRDLVARHAAELLQWRRREALSPTALAICAVLSLFRGLRGGPDGCGVQAPLRAWALLLVKVRAVEPLDAQARVWNEEHERAGELAGFDVAPHGALMPQRASSNLTICSPHLFWFAGHGDLTQFHDAPPLSGCFEPWLEKRGRGAAIQSRKLWFKKAAWRGGILYYPEGVSNVGTAESPQYVDNQDLARQALDTLEAGGTMAISSDVNPATNQRKWEYIPPESYSDVAGLREYPQDLDREILTGAGIPPEVLEASEVGSGWSGRMVPLMGYLGTVDELAGLLLESCDSWLAPLVALNFGENAWYEVKPQSLVDELQQQQQQGAMPGGGQPGLNPSSLFDGKPPAGGPGGPSGGGGDGPQQPGPGGAGGPLSLSVTIPEDLIRKAERAAGAHKYACAHVEVPRELAAQLKTLAYSIPNTDLYDPANGKGRELESHVTVRFGLLTDEAADLAPIAADAPPARVTFTGIGHFDGAAEGKPYDVVFASVDSADLRRLNRELAALPHHDTHPEYVPHATIAYVRAGMGAQWARRLTLMAANLAGRDFIAPALVLSARDGGKTEVLLGALAGPRELSWGARGPLSLAWTPYKGPKGGAGWVSDTGEVRYQESKPADHEANPEVGLESVFAHPDFAHIPSDNSDVAGVRAEYHDKAIADGHDPAELHRRAAEQTERWARLAIQDEPELMPADKAVARLTERHAAMAKSAQLHGEHAERERKSLAVYDDAITSDPKNADLYNRYKSEALERLANHESNQKKTEGYAADYAAKLTKARAGHVVSPLARAALARRAYDQVHGEMSGERASKEFARDFADSYFEQDDPKKRAQAFVAAFTGDDGLDPTLLPEDARAAVAEDLAHLPANKLAATVAAVSTNWGWLDRAGGPGEQTAPFHAALELAAAGKKVKPVPFDGSKPGDYVLYHADDVDGDLLDAARSLSRTIAPATAAKFAGDEMLVVKKGSALHKALSEHDEGADLSEEAALQKLRLKVTMTRTLSALLQEC